MNQRNLKIIIILLILISTLTSCKKKSSVRPPGYYPPTTITPDSGSWTLNSKGSGYACWAYNGSGTPTSNPSEPSETGSGRWEWHKNNGCWLWIQTGTGTVPTPSTPIGYNNLTGTKSPEYTSNCYEQGISDAGGGSLPYYQEQAIGHGTGYPPPVCDIYNSNCVVWTSLKLGDQTKLQTDSRFNFRIVAKKPPQQGTLDYKGRNCQYLGLPFSKIALRVKIRAANSNIYTAAYDISGIEVGKCSDVIEVPSVKIPVTRGPLVIDIFNIETDYSCKIYENTAYQGKYPYCPYIELNSTDCFELEVQFATDYTLDIPH